MGDMDTTTKIRCAIKRLMDMYERITHHSLTQEDDLHLEDIDAATKFLRSAILDIRDQTEPDHNVIYLCDGKVKECRIKQCLTCGDDCLRTTDIRHAKNFKCIGDDKWLEIEQ